jgi:hypothetical protein
MPLYGHSITPLKKQCEKGASGAGRKYGSNAALADGRNMYAGREYSTEDCSKLLSVFIEERASASRPALCLANSYNYCIILHQRLNVNQKLKVLRHRIHMTGASLSLLYTVARGKPRSGAKYSSDRACPCHVALHTQRVIITLWNEKHNLK